MATNPKGWTGLPTKNNRRQQRIQRYWQQRETDNRKQRLKRAKSYDREVERIYKRMLDEIQKEIDSFYRKYATDEGITMAEAKRRASQLDIEEYARKAAQYVAERDLSDTANAEMKLYNMTMKANRLELLKSKIGLEMVGGFDQMEKLFGEKLTSETMEEFTRQAGILGDTILKNASSANVDALVNGSFHNASWSDRIWAHQDLLRMELDKLLTTGIIQGRNPNDMARELRKTIDSSVYNSERLLRTEMARVQTEAQKNSYAELGFTEYQFIACGGPDVCEICKAIDGETFKLDDMEPGTNAPPIHPNCHCSSAPYEDEDEYEAWLDFLDNGGSTEEWNEWGMEQWKDAQTGAAYTVKSNEVTYGGYPHSWEKIENEGIDDALKRVNPNYKRAIPKYLEGTVDDYTNNCTNCVVAYEMRMRGYDVTACSVGENKRLKRNPFSAWKGDNVRATTGNGLEDIESFLNGKKDGVRIEIAVDFKSRPYYNHYEGHTFVAERREGKTVYLDPQSGRMIDTSIFDHVLNGKTRFLRIDNLELSDRGISACKKVT